MAASRRLLAAEATSLRALSEKMSCAERPELPPDPGALSSRSPPKGLGGRSTFGISGIVKPRPPSLASPPANGLFGSSGIFGRLKPPPSPPSLASPRKNGLLGALPPAKGLFGSFGASPPANGLLGRSTFG